MAFQRLCDVDSDEESECPPPEAFLREVTRFLNVPRSDLVEGRDNANRAPVRWCAGERRLYRSNPLRLDVAFVRKLGEVFDAAGLACCQQKTADAVHESHE